MYTRNYYNENNDGIVIPDGYDGTALLEKSPETQSEQISDMQIQRDSPPPPPKKEVKISPNDLHIADENTEETEDVFRDNGDKSFGFRFPSFSLGNGLSFFKNLVPKRLYDGKLFSDFGFEDVLILGIALFLFFSKDGDRELGLMLALLVFIGNE